MNVSKHMILTNMGKSARNTPDIALVIRTAVFGILFGMTELPLMAQCAPIVAQVSGEFDCAYGGTVRWNGLFFTGGFAITSPCGGAMNYSLLSFSDPGYNSSGLVTEDWVQRSPRPAGAI